jgi:hypothetical protein
VARSRCRARTAKAPVAKAAQALRTPAERHRRA